MESTNEGSCNNEVSTARTRFARGKSLKACMAKAAGWTLEKAKDVTMVEIKEYKMTWCGLSRKLLICVDSNGILELYIGILRRELLRVIPTFPTRAGTKSRVGNFGWQLTLGFFFSIGQSPPPKQPIEPILPFT